ncbi:MAG: alkaline phosphatase D family protein, partial [Chloroflexi bacterium]|nr:alkaline phosphatase D family protein [Chloroflexota bacterium]
MPEQTQLLLGPLVGGLSHDHVNLWARSSGPATFHAWLGRQPDFSDAKLAGRSLPLSDATGCAGVVPLDNLEPETSYFYALTLNSKPLPKADGQFRTFPRPGQPRAFNFAFGSCFRPKGENSGAAFRALESRRQEDELRFILLLGDQVYADAWEYNGISKVAANLTDYRNVYTHVWSNPHFRALLKNLPAFMTLDDHEVDDDWRWTDSRRRWASIPWWDQAVRWLKGHPPEEWYLPHHRVRDALQAYWEHQGMHAPAMTLPPELNYAGQYKLREQDPGSLAYTFTYGAAAFFVMDTRSMRVQGRSGKTMLGEGQWQALEDWLRAVKDDFPLKFLVTSCSALYSMWTDIPR